MPKGSGFFTSFNAQCIFDNAPLALISTEPMQRLNGRIIHYVYAATRWKLVGRLPAPLSGEYLINAIDLGVLLKCGEGVSMPSGARTITRLCLPVFHWL